ncbi:MAG: crossover junction endodeoxyribonuclease RuvC [Patescibacteria group bacterium]
MTICKKVSSKLRVLGIDPGTATVGWGIVEERNGQLRAVAFGHIATSPKKTDEERLVEISKDLKIILAKYLPREVGIEKLFFFKNQKTVMEVSQARGAIILTMSQKDVKVFSYTPLEVKQAVTGYGRAEKKQIQLMTKEILGLDKIPRPDDTADALAIAICHLNSRKVKGLK